MTKTIHEIEEFSFPSKEKFLRRGKKKNLFWLAVQTAVFNWVYKWNLKKTLMLFVVIGVLSLTADILVARASSVFQVNESMVQAVKDQCEAKVRQLTN